MSLLKPERLHLLRMVVLKKALPDVSRCLVKCSAVHVEQAANFIPHDPDYTPVTTDDIQEAITALKKDIKTAAESLGTRADSRHGLAPGRIPRLDPFNAVDIIRKELDDINSRVRPLKQTVNLCKEKTTRLETLSWITKRLAEKQLDPGAFQQGSQGSFRVGLIPNDAFDTLAEALEGIPNLMEVALNPEGTLLLVCLGVLKEHRSDLQQALLAAQWTPVTIPPEYINKCDLLEKDLRETAARCEKANAELRALKEDETRRLRELWADLILNQRVLKVMDRCLQSRAGYFMAAWVPSRCAREITDELTDSLGRKLWIDSRPAEEVPEVLEEHVTVPTCLDHPGWLRPFRCLVEMYGQPAYHNFDPTILFAVSFMIMFGMMFGDIGHGLTLAALGWMFTVVLKKSSFFHDFGGVLMYCGGSAVVFGILFGSLFGFEHMFEPLWFRPLEEPLIALKIGITLGVSLMSMALIFNLAQCIRSGRLRSGLFGQWGLCSTLFYWSALVLLFDVFRKSGRAIPVWAGILMLGVPLLAVTAGDHLFWKWRTETTGKRTFDKHILSPPGEGDGDAPVTLPEEELEEPELSETLFKPMEIILSLMANTVSFIRVAAFALNHAALMAAVFEVQKVLESGFIGDTLSLIMGNVLIVFCEGIVVLIQCMRLEYYEVFSKIFSDTGRKFEKLA